MMAKGAVGEIATQDMCILKHGEMTIATFGRTTAFNERWHYDDNGLAPEEYDVVVIKTPHAQPEMFDEWVIVSDLFCLPFPSFPAHRRSVCADGASLISTWTRRDPRPRMSGSLLCRLTVLSGQQMCQFDYSAIHSGFWILL